MKQHRALRIAGVLMGILSMILAIVWYDWKLALIIFIALIGNNLEQDNK